MLIYRHLHQALRNSYPTFLVSPPYPLIPSKCNRIVPLFLSLHSKHLLYLSQWPIFFNGMFVVFLQLDSLLPNTLYPHIIFISETWLFPSRNCIIPHFYSFRQDRVDGNGGVAIASHTSLYITLIEINPP